MAFDIVMQGFRIRLGRSLITMFGVILGIMFLIASASTFIIGGSVKEEDRLRSESTRMINTLLAESGSLESSAVGIIQTGPISEVERRMIDALSKEKPEALLWMSEGGEAQTGNPAFQNVQPSTTGDIAASAKCIIVVGGGRISEAALSQIAAARYTQPIAFTSAIPESLTAGSALYFVEISGKPSPEEMARMSKERRMARSRLIWILTISLLVTIINICNAMLMSVVERFREIGTMKCLGADSRFVRRLFIIESLLIGICGGFGGAVSGALLTLIYHGLVYGFVMVFSSLNYPALALCFVAGTAAGMIISMLAALYPANIASAMVPANALRHNA